MQVNDCGNQLGLLSVKQPAMLFIIFFYHKKWTTELVRKRFQSQGESLGLFSCFFQPSYFLGGVRGAAEETSCGQHPRLAIIE